MIGYCQSDLIRIQGRCMEGQDRLEISMLPINMFAGFWVLTTPRSNRGEYPTKSAEPWPRAGSRARRMHAQHHRHVRPLLSVFHPPVTGESLHMRPRLTRWGTRARAAHLTSRYAACTIARSVVWLVGWWWWWWPEAATRTVKRTDQPIDPSMPRLLAGGRGRETERGSGTCERSEHGGALDRFSARTLCRFESDYYFHPDRCRVRLAGTWSAAMEDRDGSWQWLGSVFWHRPLARAAPECRLQVRSAACSSSWERELCAIDGGLFRITAARSLYCEQLKVLK